MSANPIPRIEPRRVAGVNRLDGFTANPILSNALMPHDVRREWEHGLTRRCGYCGEMVTVGPEWEAHKQYCWGHMWHRGFTGGPDSHLRVEDRQWAEGDRSMRR